MRLNTPSNSVEYCMADAGAHSLACEAWWWVSTRTRLCCLLRCLLPHLEGEGSQSVPRTKQPVALLAELPVAWTVDVGDGYRVYVP